MKFGMKSISLAASSAILGTVLLSGCGGGSLASALGLNGVVIKGYLDGAIVQADLDCNGEINTTTEQTTTDANGNYSFASSPSTGCTPEVVISGGIDTATNTANAVELRAPFNSTGKINVNQATTFVSQIMNSDDSNKTTAEKKAEAEALVSTMMGISVDDIVKDPIATAETNATLLNETMKTARLIETLVNKIGGGVTFGEIASDIAKKIKDNNSTDFIAQAKAVATEKGASINTEIDAINTLFNSLPTSAINKDDINNIETAALAAVKIVEADPSKASSVNIVNLADLVKAAKSNETNASKVMDLNAFVNIAKDINTSASDFNATSEASKASGVFKDQDTYKKEQEEIAAQKALEQQMAVDTLKLKDNKVTIGSGDNTVVANLGSNGLFTSINHQNVSAGDLSSLYSMSFELQNTANMYGSLEDGDDKNVTIALKIDSGSTKKLLAVMNGVSLTRVDSDSNTSNYNGEYTIAITSATKLNAWAVKSSGQQISQGSISLDADSVSSTNGVISANIGSIVSKLESDAAFASSIDTIKNQLTQNGSYTVSAYISGVSGVVGAVQSNTDDVTSGFTNADASSLFSGKISKISGSVNIGLSAAEIKALNVTAVAAAKTACTLGGNLTDLTSDLTLPSSKDGVTVTWSSSDTNVISDSGVISASTTTGSATLTATLTKGSGDTLVTDTKTFNVTVKALENSAPTITSSISAQTLVKDAAMTSITVTATDTADQINDTVTFSATGLPTGISIDSDTGVISGTPTSEQNTTATITATDGSLSDTLDVNFSVVTDPTGSYSQIKAMEVSGQWVTFLDTNKNGTFDTGETTPVQVLSLEKWNADYTLLISNAPDTTKSATAVVFGDTIGYTTSANGTTTTEVSPYSSFDAVIKFDTGFATGTKFVVDFGSSNQKEYTK